MKTIIVNVAGTEVAMTAFNRSRVFKYQFKGTFQLRKYANVRILGITLLGKDFRVAWTPRNQVMR